MESQGAKKKTGARDVIVSILINGVVPLLVYSLLKDHMSELSALTIASVVPILDNILTFLKHRHLDVFGMFMIAALLVSIIAILMGGSPKLLLIRESLVTGGLGLVFLLTLFLPRPLLYYFAMHFTAGNDRPRRERFAENWSVSYFRQMMYVMTVVWGAGMVIEALVRTYLVFHLSTMQFLAVSPLVNYGTMGLLILWTVSYRKTSVRRMKALKSTDLPKDIS